MIASRALSRLETSGYMDSLTSLPVKCQMNVVLNGIVPLVCTFLTKAESMRQVNFSLSRYEMP